MQGSMTVDSSAETDGDRLLLSTPSFQISGRSRRPHRGLPHAPLIVAVPGGGYGWRYFDVDGHSLLQRASALGIPAIALDRPGYGDSTPLEDATILSNAVRLNEVVGELWTREDSRTQGVVLVGHSIGGAVAVAMASLSPDWPLLGLAISGVGLTPPPEITAAWEALPDFPVINMPSAVKHAAMFGPAWTYDADAPARSGVADAPAPRSELIDIVKWWPQHIAGLAARVTAPLHYRLGEMDSLWAVSNEEVARFSAAFRNAAEMNGRVYRNAGHCIDFHRVGAAFQLEQLAFALRCSSLASGQEPRRHFSRG